MKKVFAIIDCSIPINTRNQKIIDSLKASYEDAEFHIITWNREGLKLGKNKYFHAYESVAAYADVKAKLKGLLGFRRYIIDVLTEISADVIIASHWSNLMLVASAKGKGQVLIYDNLDIPTGKFPIRKVECFIESLCLKKVDLIIHASRFFSSLYEQLDIPQIVLENKPSFAPCIKTCPSCNKPLKVAFVGTIRYKDILQNLADALMDNPEFELYFHGCGEDYDAMMTYCKNATNVFFTGKYDYSTIVSLYHQSDVIWAGYPNKDYNVKYAISNKFHESLYVGVPCIFSIGTKLADFVKTNNLGLVVDPYDTAEIKELFQRIASGEEDVSGIIQSMLAYQYEETTWADDFKQIVNFLNK